MRLPASLFINADKLHPLQDASIDFSSSKRLHGDL